MFFYLHKSCFVIIYKVFFMAHVFSMNFFVIFYQYKYMTMNVKKTLMIFQNKNK